MIKANMNTIDELAKARTKGAKDKKKRIRTHGGGPRTFLNKEQKEKIQSDRYYARAMRARKAGDHEKFVKYTKLAWADKSLVIEEPFEKARSHKYVRRLGVPKAYRYVYGEPQAKVKEKWEGLKDWESRGEKKFPLHSKTYDEFTGKIQRHAIKNARALVEGKTMKMERPFGLHWPTVGELEHENHRINTMSQRALEARMHKITDPQKMYSFAVALEQQGMHGMAQDARHELNRLGYESKGVAQPYLKKETNILPGYEPGKIIPLKESPKKYSFPTARGIMGHLGRQIDKVGGPKDPNFDKWMGYDLDVRHHKEIEWMTQRFDFSKMSKEQLLKLAGALENENYHGPAGYLYKLAEGEKPKAVLPAKGEKIQRAPRHIILSEEPEHDAYREALLAKEKKEGGVKKDKAGNIIAEKKPQGAIKQYLHENPADRRKRDREIAKEYVEKRAQRDKQKRIDKELAQDPWGNIPGYGRTYKMEAPFKKKEKTVKVGPVKEYKPKKTGKFRTAYGWAGGRNYGD